ncbi:MAG: hypothetical protein Q7J38_00865 [Gallionella sp.]|nr:hypothetical protein [Gallionella sp.]
MKYRECSIFTGATFLVPDNIQRIESQGHGTSGATYGWQVRYGENEPFFGDHTSDGSGAEASLAEATKELIRRVHLFDAPTKLKRNISSTKTNDLPTGISGPQVRIRKNRKVSEYSFQVVIPRFDDKPANKMVYIGTENTFTDARYDEALAKAIAFRNKAAEAYQEAATKARRARTPKHKSRK